MPTEIRQIDTPAGVARSYLDRPAVPARGLLVLGHGAGGSVESFDLRIVRDSALDLGIMVVRIEQPYRVAGRRSPAPARMLDTAWVEVVRVVRRRRRALPLIVGGRSSGARVACRTAGDVGAAAVVVLAFPLHWPGRPDSSRLPELDSVSVPVLAISGERDPFGVPPESPERSLTVLPGRVHDLKGPAAPLAEAFRSWISGLEVLPTTG